MPFFSSETQKIPISSGFGLIGRSDFNKIVNLLSRGVGHYMQREEIFKYSKERISTIAYIVDGSVSLELKSEFGITESAEIYNKGDVLGEMFSLPPISHEFVAKANSDCSIIFFDMQKILYPKAPPTTLHATFLSELLKISALKSKMREERLLILSKYKLRDKLLTFLSFEKARSNSNSFKISFSQSELANYLFVERSSLAREISILNKEGLIKSHGKHFELLI